MLSDGSDNRSKSTTKAALKAAQSADATIYTVDMSPINSNQNRGNQNRAVLKKLSKETGGRFLKTPGGIAFRAAFAEIVRELGIQYTIGYQSSNEKEDGKVYA